jgi:hypothetical protein
MEFAKPGRVVKIRASPEEWDNGWVVVEAFGSLSQAQLNNQRSAQKELAGKLEGH